MLNSLKISNAKTSTVFIPIIAPGAQGNQLKYPNKKNLSTLGEMPKKLVK